MIYTVYIHTGTWNHFIVVLPEKACMHGNTLFSFCQPIQLVYLKCIYKYYCCILLDEQFQVFLASLVVCIFRVNR